MLCTLGASVFTRFMSRFITVADNNPGWRNPLVIGWAGMRGVVSLAAALSIPLLINDGQPFPYRNLILFITFIVILVTLVFQGLTLPWLDPESKTHVTSTNYSGTGAGNKIQKKIVYTSIQYLEEKFGEEWGSNEHLKNLHERFTLDLNFYVRAIGWLAKIQKRIHSKTFNSFTWKC